MEKIIAKAHVTIEVNIRANNEQAYSDAIKDLWRHGVDTTKSKGFDYSWSKRKIISIDNRMKITDTTE